MAGAARVIDLLALAAALAWLGLLRCRDGFWRCDQTLDEQRPVSTRDVLAIVPARDEAATIAASVASLLRQDYAGRLDVVVVDDGSGDDTGARAAALTPPAGRGLHVHVAPPPPAGRSGKVAAQRAGLAFAQARGLEAPWLWFTDADIVHAPATLSRLVATAERRRVAMVSVMADLNLTRPVERWLVPAFVYFFQLLYPFRAVNDPGRAVAAAAGGCMLVERSALEAAGGLAAIEDRLIDDVALGAAVKRTGRPIRLVLAHACRSLRVYDFAAFWTMVRRTAFTELRHSWWRLAGALAGLALLFVMPLAAMASGRPLPVGAGALALAAMAVSARPILAWYGLAPWRAVLFPPAAWAYAAMTLHSAIAHGQGRTAAWRGRVYRS
jgi:hopene-associated glycosyltransferase HpnB